MYIDPLDTRYHKQKNKYQQLLWIIKNNSCPEQLDGTPIWCQRCVLTKCHDNWHDRTRWNISCRDERAKMLLANLTPEDIIEMTL